MKKPIKVLFDKGHLGSIDAIERRLALINEMERLLGKVEPTRDQRLSRPKRTDVGSRIRNSELPRLSSPRR